MFRDGSEPRDEFYKRLAELNPAQLARTTESRVQELTRQWQQNQLDNFGYLSALNEEADRSRHDLTQYPVFPWILADYTSATLDLDNPMTFRDLSKPIGALEANRLKQFKERFESMDPSGDPPPFLYGTHYSTPGFVLFYLIRERPEEMLRLQSGRFDAPDRMFHSIVESWKNVLTNPADVKELIPEFYVGSGDFLINSKRLDLGKRGGDGKRVNDVELPPWANNSAKGFVAKMRQAMESEYVSEHLHLWIDLIFGCDQRSVERDNVFFHLTYQDASIKGEMDEATRKGHEVQVMEFGQTPKQLFTRPHPKRTAVVPLVLDMSELSGLVNNHTSEPVILAPTPVVVEEPSLNHFMNEDDVDLKRTKWTFNQKTKFKSTNWIDVLPAQAHVMDSCVSSFDHSYFAAACKDGSLVFLSSNSITRRVRIIKLDLSCLGECSEEDLLVGSWDNALYRYSVATGRVRARVENAHDDSVTACHARRNGHYVATGGSDAAVKIWSNDTFEAVCAFYDHEAPITSVAMSEDEYLVLSGDENGNMFMHDTRIGPDAVWTTTSSGNVKRGPCHVAWLSTRSKVLMSHPFLGVKLMDCRKDKVIVEVQGPSWRPRTMLTDGEKVMVGDATGRITVALVDKLEQVPFESNVLLRHTANGQPSAISTMSVSDQHGLVLTCCEQGVIGLSSISTQ